MNASSTTVAVDSSSELRHPQEERYVVESHSSSTNNGISTSTRAERTVMNPLRADHVGPLDMFKIGVGPSSSHTVGPMIAALQFRRAAIEDQELQSMTGGEIRVEVELYGSLSATGRGHSTDAAVCAGLAGMHPGEADPTEIWAAMPCFGEKQKLVLGRLVAKFNPEEDIKWHNWSIDGDTLPHPNTLRFRLYVDSQVRKELTILSVGGGFVEAVDPTTGQRRAPSLERDTQELPFPYNSAAEFVDQCVGNNKQPWEIVIANEEARGLPEPELRGRLAEILKTFAQCIDRGLNEEGILPGGLNVRRRAKALYEQLNSGKTPGLSGGELLPSIYAMAVNEENAAGGRVVTAPTNGSSGIIPSVWRTLQDHNHLSQRTLENGLIVASVIGALVKTHASISGAEVGCQGEVGTSCAMAAAGAVAMLGGTPYQMEQAAEIGIEHHLGMTCDPIKGLVQVPCIERNAMGAVKALNAAFLSLASDGKHLISLDRALEVMKQTGLDMNQKYKETATGGLALG